MEKRIVLDANIILRAILGTRVRNLLASFDIGVDFCVPEYCVEEVFRNLPKITNQKRMNHAQTMRQLDELLNSSLRIIEPQFYLPFEKPARARMARRDPDDWPIVAAALALDAPIWTEDRHFFGIGLATWATDLIDLYFAPDTAAHAS